MGADESDQIQAQARARDLLEATHQFPCDYSVTVIAYNREGVTTAIRRAAHSGPDDGVNAPEGSHAYQSRESREGKYLSHRFAVRVSQAQDVLELYARLRSIEGVVTLL